MRKYRLNAIGYDQAGRRFERFRARSIDLLELSPGQTVLDVGCGTGLSLDRLERGVGAAGRVIGIEQSPHMLAKARDRAAGSGWSNVTFLDAPVEEAAIPVVADAALFSFVHDIMQTSAALDNVFAHLRPGARIAAAGIKAAPWWNMPLNLYVWVVARLATTTRENLDCPWRGLLGFVPALRVEQSALGIQYVVSGEFHPRDR
jgi:ubiquinone/menaquinone biosynthesis C-methylase UbiE